MKRLLERFVAGGFGVALLLLCGVGMAFHQSIQKLVENQLWLEHTHQVLEALDNTLLELDTAERGRRGYIITGKAIYLEFYDTSLQKTDREIKAVRKLTVDSPSQQHQLDKIEPLIAKRLALLQRSLDLLQKHKSDTSIQIFLTDPGRVQQQEIQARLAVMQNKEQALLQHRSAATSSSVQNTILIVSLCYGLSFSLLFGVYLLLQKQICERNQARDELEVRVQKRTAELTKINLSLQAEIAERLRVESALQKSEERFHLAVLNAPFPLMLHAEDGEVLLISKAWTELTGYTHNDIPTIADWIERAYGGEKEFVRDYIQRLYSLSQAVSEGEYIINTSNNETRIWDFSSAPLGQIPEGKRLAITMAMDVTERKKAESQLKASLGEKEVLLKEIHHRVKNNLQIISSLLNLQAGYLQDDQAVELFKVSQSRIESMALIHEKLYQSKDLAEINLAEYIQDLVDSLFCSYEVRLEAITVKLHIDNILVNLDTAIPCGLIINELVLNSIKYAFPPGKTGEMYIGGMASDDSNNFILIVGDNGIGFPPDFDFRNTESLGLQLVNILTNQLEGTILLDASKGVEFRITFPFKKDPLADKVSRN